MKPSLKKLMVKIQNLEKIVIYLKMLPLLEMSFVETVVVFGLTLLQEAMFTS